MVGIASRYFAGRIALAVAAATVIGVLTGMDGTGHVVMYATIVLGTAGGAFALLASLALTVGDADSPDRDHSHAYQPVPSYWPVMAAVGMGVLMVGLVTDGSLAIAGTALLIIAAVEWTMSAWAEHLSTDAQANAVERARLLGPFEIALYGALAIAVPVLLASRVLLAASKNASSLIAIVVSAVILAFAFVVYAKPRLRRSIVATMVALGVVALIVAGIASAVIGERDFEHHEPAAGHESDATTGDADDSGGHE